MNLYSLDLISILPFRPDIKGFLISKRYKSEKWETIFTFSLQETFITETFGTVISKEELRYQSIAKIETKLPYKGDKEAAKKHAQIRNPVDHVTPNLIEKLNYFLYLTRYSGRELSSLQNVRNVGLLDLSFYCINFEGETIFSRGNLSRPGKRNQSPELKQIEQDIPKEWSLISKSQDLVNHGFPSEGLLVAFALLDYQAQQFIEIKMGSLSPKEKDKILRGIEQNRLNIYLGPLCKLLIGKSILDDEEMAKKLSWINKKRNDIMHNGDYCNSKDAERGLNIILEFLKYLSSNGLKMELPDKLLIW